MFAKQPIEEWANGMAAVVNGHRREAAVLFHEFSELDQHLFVGRRYFGLNLQTAKKAHPCDCLGDEFFLLPFGRRGTVLPRPSACSFFNLLETDLILRSMSQFQVACDG